MNCDGCLSEYDDPADLAQKNAGDNEEKGFISLINNHLLINAKAS
jgi:hypothetical protein